MDEKQRTKLLGGILAAVLCFMWLRPKLMEPVNRAKADLSRAETKMETAEKHEMEQLVAQETISNAIDTSLPPDDKDAQRLYQSWITNLAEQCRFSQLDVKPGGAGGSRGDLATVEVLVEAETDLEGISRFMYLFEKAELMHRVSSLEINSTGSSGKPRMEIKLTAEGMSMADAAQRSDIFSRTVLADELAEDATTLRVAEAADFPKKAPFLVQIGREMVRVTSVNDGEWTIERGIEGSTAATHDSDENVYQFPIAPTNKDVEFANYETLLNSSPFVKPAKPRTYSPRIASVLDKTIAPGDSVEMTARAEDIDKDRGVAQFAIEDGEEGMTIDPETGKFQWQTAEDIEPKRYEVKFVLTQKNNDELRKEKVIGITVQLPNEAPSLTVPEEAIVVLGQDFSLDITGEDDAGPEQLKYSLDGDIPEGLTIDESSGKMTWTPAKTFEPGEYSVAVKVTDGGEPAKSATDSLKLNVQDDDALLTKFTGSVALDGEPIAWFRNIAKKSRPELRVGDRILVAEIDAELTEIARRHVLMSDKAGVWKVQLGDNLRERILVKAAVVPEESDGDDDGDAQEKKDEYDKDPPAESEGAPAESEESTAVENESSEAESDSPTSTADENSDANQDTDSTPSAADSSSESEPEAKSDVETPTTEKATD